jgi:NAD(P)-dependent dehydrogenase (short-subunit alcohol dehydrogenase family)
MAMHQTNNLCLRILGKEFKMVSNLKVALVTGGASGMGQVMALRLAEQGVKVAIVDMNRQALDTTVAQSTSIHAYMGDVTQASEIAAIVEDVEQRLGPIDRLAASAGIMPAAGVSSMPTSDFAKVMRVNYEGTVNVVKAVLPTMQKRQKGEIVLFGSLAGVVFTKRFAAYNASKAAVNAFGEVLAQELASDGIRVLNVRPAAVKTPLIAQATGADGLQALRKQAEQGRMASPQQIVDSIEAALARGQTVLYPTFEAKFGAWLRRFSPRLTWAMVNAVSH